MAVTELGRTIGARVRALRCAMGFSQQTFATGAGIARENIAHLERGANQASTEAMRAALARGFGLSRDDLALFLAGDISVETAKRRAQKAG